MEKLTKENIYIDLRGKSKEELTELWEFLTINGEKCYRDKEYFSETNIQYGCLHLYYGLWAGYDDDKVNDKTEVTIEELKEILKMTRNQELREEAKKRGYTHNNFKCLNKSYNRTSIESLDRWYYNELEDTLFTNTRMNGGKAVYKNGIWADFIETLQEKAIRLENELKEVKRQIEEENKPKVGDLCNFWDDDENDFVVGVIKEIHECSRFKYETTFDCQFPNCKKITDQELINKLNELIK